MGSRSVGIFQKDHSLPVVSAGIAVGQQAGKRGRHLLPGRSEYPSAMLPVTRTTAYCLTSGGSRRSCAAMLRRPFPGTNWTA